MKYRIFTLLGLLALSGGMLLQAQDYDDIYYDASTSKKGEAKTTKVTKPAKTIAVYGEVPEKYKVAVQDNYRVDRDIDEYNRHGVYEPDFEVDINGDTIYFNGDSIYDYDEAFANTRRIERFYNPDIVILSDDDDLVELYYSETPTVNLIIGSDFGYSSYGWGYDSYFPWYTHRAYYPWYRGWYDPWYYSWYTPWYYDSYWYGPRLWGWNYWGYHPWYYRPWYGTYGWNGWYGNNWHNNYWNGRPSRPTVGHHNGWRENGGRVGLANNRNGRDRVTRGVNRSPGVGNNGTSVGTGTRTRGGVATSRGGGNMGSRGSSGVTTRSGGGVSRSSGSSGRSYTGGSNYGGSRASGGSSSYGGSRSSGSSYGGSRSSGSSYGGSHSSGSSHSSGGSYSGGSRGGSSGGGSHGGGGSSGGGGRRR